MDIKRITLVSLGIIFTCYFTACRKITGCTTHQSSDVFEVEIPISLYPAKDTFEIGDTIWIEQNFSEKMYDKVNGMTLDFSKFYFSNDMVTSDLLNPFDFSSKHLKVAEVGTFTAHNSYANTFGYLHEEGFYKSKIMIQLTEKGLFKFGFQAMQEKSDFTKCPEEYLSIYFNTNNKGDNNFHMMKESPDSITANASKEVFDQIGSYCFYVK